jgi:hypothetical protein
MAFNGEIFGLPIPDAGPIFATALVIHILCGLTAVIAGRSPRLPGNNPDVTRLPDGSTCGGPRRNLCHRDDHGRDPLARRCPPIRHRRHCVQPRPVRIPRSPTPPTRLGTSPRHRHGRLLHRPTHRLLRRQWSLPPRWDRLPHLTYWLLPSLIGGPLIWRTLCRFARATTDAPSHHLSHARGPDGRT